MKEIFNTIADPIKGALGGLTENFNAQSTLQTFGPAVIGAGLGFGIASMVSSSLPVQLGAAAIGGFLAHNFFNKDDVPAQSAGPAANADAPAAAQPAPVPST